MMDCRVPSPPRLRRATNSLGRRSFGKGGKPGNDNAGSVGPGERDLVERLRPELLRGARDHTAAERAIEFGGGIVVGERPDHHALQAALRQIALGRGEQAAAETESLELRPQ